MTVVRQNDARANPPPPAERLENAAAFLSRTDLRELGFNRRAVDAIFAACPVIELPGYSRPLIRVTDYRQLVEANTFRGDRVRTPVVPKAFAATQGASLSGSSSPERAIS